MECLIFKSEISNTFSSVTDFSFEEKRTFLNEEKINALVDAIVEFKKLFSEKTKKINSLNKKLKS